MVSARLADRWSGRWPLGRGGETSEVACRCSGKWPLVSVWSHAMGGALGGERGCVEDGLQFGNEQLELLGWVVGLLGQEMECACCLGVEPA